MAWYAVWRIRNPIHSDTGFIGGFIIGEHDEVPIHEETKKAIVERLHDHILYRAGLVEFIEID